MRRRSSVVAGDDGFTNDVAPVSLAAATDYRSLVTNAPATTMTNRERMLAVIRGDRADRVPFAQYADPASPEEVWALVGRENVGLIRWIGLHRIETPHCRIDSEEIGVDGRRGQRRTLHTPAGDLEEVRVYQPDLGVLAARDHFLREPVDYHVLLAYLRDMQVTGNLDAYTKLVADLGEDGIPHPALPRTPFQQLWIQWVCLEDLCLHLADEPDLLAEVFAAMEDVQRRVFHAAVEVARRAPVAHICFPDNITAPVIGRRYFERHCLPAYAELADMLDLAGLGATKLFCHADGDLKPLWDLIGASALNGLDSLSPPPDNDTSVAAAAEMWPAMRLWVNFPSSVHLAEPEVISQTARQILHEAGATGRLQIQISENVPPGRWQASYPQIVKAIDEYSACGGV